VKRKKERLGTNPRKGKSEAQACKRVFVPGRERATNGSIPKRPSENGSMGTARERGK